MGNERIINSNTSKKISIFMIACCVLVVIYHSTGYKYYEMDQSLFNIIAKYIVDLKNPCCQLVALPGFCFFSGFLFYKNVGRERFPYESIRDRFFSLIVPYLIWNLIWTLFMVIISCFPAITNKMSTIPVFSWTLKEFLGGVLLHQYCGVTWYLLYMFVYALISPILCRVYKYKTLSLALIAIVVLVSPAEEILFNNRVLIWPLYMYMLGGYFAVFDFDRINSLNKSRITQIWLILFVVLLFFGSQWEPTGYLFSLIYNILRGIGFYFAWNIFNLFYEKIPVKKWMGYYFYIYVFHNIPLLCIDKILRIIMPDNWIGLLLNHFIGVSVVVLLAIGSAWTIEQFFPQVWYLLTGRRRVNRIIDNENTENRGE